MAAAGSGLAHAADHGVELDLGDARALIVMWGPEDTVRNNEAKFNAMVRGMREP